MNSNILSESNIFWKYMSDYLAFIINQNFSYGWTNVHIVGEKFLLSHAT